MIICPEHKLGNIISEYLNNNYIGISELHYGLKEIQLAYMEALKARKKAFVQGNKLVYFDDEEGQYEKIPSNFVEQFIQLFGSGQIERCVLKFINLYSKAKRGLVDVESLLETTNSILVLLFETYEKMIDFKLDDFTMLRNPLKFNHANEYCDEFVGWLQDMKIIINQEFSDYQSKEKINDAIIFIQNNYANDLNMAVVSNHISMNYSLFSLNFKEYTGVNFINYLKNIRIEKAKELLMNTEDKIQDISEAVGYSNDKHFMKVFKSVTGVSPSDYRKNMSIGKNK